MKLDRVPPNNIDAERAVIGAMLIADENVAPVVLSILTKDDFYNGGNACVFEAITALFEADSNIDLLTVVQQLERNKALKKAGGVPVISEMIDSVPSTANVEYYANMVKECSMERQLLLVCAKTYHQVFDDALDFDTVISAAEKAIYDIRSGNKDDSVKPIKSVFKSTIDRMKEIADNPDGLLGIATGLHELDSCLQGLHKGALLTIAGRPGMGKSILAHQFGVYAAMHCKESTAIFSLEMPSEALGMRIASSVSEVSFDHIRRAYMSGVEWSKVIAVFNDMDNVPLYIDDTPGITVEEIRARCHQVRAQHGLGVVVVDYFQLIEKKGEEKTRLAELEAISQAMQNLARSLNVAVVLVAQLNRNVENRPDKRPMLSDIKSCGKLEEDSDVVIGIYRDAYYTKNENDHSAELIILKQRNGPLATVNLRFDGPRVRFVNC